MEKVENKDLLKSLNKKIENVFKMKHFMTGDKFFEYNRDEQLNHIEEIEKRIESINKLNDKINKIMDLNVYAPDVSSKIYLSDIIEKENITFGKNSLILAPTGSGKTTLIKNKLIRNEEQSVLMLVSNETLKLQLAPDNDDERKVLGNRMFTSQNKSVYGEGKYKVHLMTYAEFGERMYVNDNFWENISQVFCDEIHSLPEYIKYGGSNGGLIHAQRLLFNKYEDKEIFYFTATDSNLVEMEKERPGTLQDVETFDFRNYENIMQFVPVVSREITHLNQIRQYLEDRSTGFKFYNYKGIAFSKRISSLKKIEEIVIDEGFNPLVLWSSNNENNKLDGEQLRAKDELLKTNKIPEPYDFLIYNSAYQEGWDLKDNSVKLAIMNTTNETEYVQALGRLRRDVDLLVYRTKDVDKDSADRISISKEYIDKSLTTKKKEELCKVLNIVGNKGQQLTWRGTKAAIIKSGYTVEDKVEMLDGKPSKVSIIRKPSRK